MSYLVRSFKEIFFNVGKISDVLEVIQHVRESLERACSVPLTCRQYVSILNHAELQILTRVLATELGVLMCFFFLNSNLIVHKC